MMSAQSSAPTAGKVLDNITASWQNCLMTNTTHLKQAVTCETCGFKTTDVALFNNHSCDVQANGGRCEDYPCCGHEAGDCNGLLYGSDEAIKSDPHILCDHEAGICEVDYDDEPWDDGGLADAMNREAEEMTLGRPLMPNEY